MFARHALQQRLNYSVKSIPNYKGGMLLEKHFMIDDGNALKEATEAVCKLEDELIRNEEDVKVIGIIHDFDISFLNNKIGVVWEKITPLTNKDLMYLKDGKLI